MVRGVRSEAGGKALPQTGRARPHLVSCRIFVWGAYAADEIQLRVAHSLPAVCGRRARWFARLAQTNSSFRFNISPFRHAEIYFVVEAAVSAARLHSRRS